MGLFDWNRDGSLVRKCCHGRFIEPLLYSPIELFHMHHFSFLQICALSSMPSFGLMFNDFLISVGEETGAVALITSSFFSSLSFAGLFTNTLFKKFSMRTVGLIGATIYFVGSLMTVFVTSVEQLMISFSFLQGKNSLNADLLATRIPH